MTRTNWTVDAAADAHGHWTIREADGSPYGNTEVDPIATVYDDTDAAFIVEACNAHDGLVALVDVTQEALSASRAECETLHIHVDLLEGALIDCLGALKSHGVEVPSFIEQARAALGKAGAR